MTDERQLLRRYTEGSDEAFEELVAHYLNLVYSTALRRVGGDAHLAQDVAQVVFTELARRAAFLSEGVILAGWLHRATCYTAAQTLRTERRRRAREEKAVAMNLPAPQPQPQPEWDEIRPLVDEALEHLGTADRDALLLRFFQQRSLLQVGEAMGTSEEAARKRVDRALQKLRLHLGRRGITASAGALAAVLGANAVQSAPAGLASILAASAASAAASTSWLALLLFRTMALTKLQTAAICVLVATAPIAVQWHALAAAQAEQPKLRRQLTRLEDEITSQRRLLEQAERRSRYAENVLTNARADIAAHVARIRAAGTLEDPGLYLWSENSDYVRLPKTLVKSLTLSGPTEAPPDRIVDWKDLLPVERDGSLSDSLRQALGITSEEHAQVRQSFQALQQAYSDLVQSHAYETNAVPPEFRLDNRPARTWVTPAFSEAGEPLKQRLRQELEAILGPERANQVWQQAQSTFRDDFNDFGNRIRYQTVALGPGKDLSYWNVSRLPQETDFSSWLNTSGPQPPSELPAPLKEFATEWLQRPATNNQP